MQSRKSRKLDPETMPVREKIPATKVIYEPIKCACCGKTGDHVQYGSGKTSSGILFKYFICAYCRRRFRVNFKEYSAGRIIMQN